MKRRTRKPSGQWQDHYTREAKNARYPARSVFKLKEIQQRFGLMARGAAVLDLGCAPGSWLLYAAQTVGASGRAVGIDLKAVQIQLPDQAQAIQGDLSELARQSPPPWGTAPFDVVLSDMAPDTTGHRNVDHWRSVGLCESALDVACKVLRPGGGFACKIFQGPDVDGFVAQVQVRFDLCKRFKPQSCRKASKEIYIVANGYRTS